MIKYNFGYLIVLILILMMLILIMMMIIGILYFFYIVLFIKELVVLGCVDVEDNCEYLVKIINICSDLVKVEFIC